MFCAAQEIPLPAGSKVKYCPILQGSAEFLYMALSEARHYFQSLKDEWLDGLRLIEDITLQDSMGHEILAINDGTYITIGDGVHKLFGEAYRIKDGQIEMICQNGMSIILEK